MPDKLRTNRQNKALHKMFEMLAQELNDSGLDMKKTLKPEVDIPWSKQTVKDYLWRPIMKAMTNKTSTTQMTTKEIDRIFEVINKHLGEKFGLQIDFPSIESLIYRTV